MTIAALSVRAGEAVEDGGFRDLQIRQSQDRFGGAILSLRVGFVFITCGLQRHKFMLQPSMSPWVRVARDTGEKAKAIADLTTFIKLPGNSSIKEKARQKLQALLSERREMPLSPDL